PLARLAELHDVAILCVSHLNKGGDNKALYRVTGSLAFGAAARTVHLVGTHPDELEKSDPHRVFTPIKNNLAQRGTPSLVFKIASKEIDHHPLPIHTSRVEWVE